MIDDNTDAFSYQRKHLRDKVKAQRFPHMWPIILLEIVLKQPEGTDVT